MSCVIAYLMTPVSGETRFTGNTATGLLSVSGCFEKKTLTRMPVGVAVAEPGAVVAVAGALVAVAGRGAGPPLVEALESHAAVSSASRQSSSTSAGRVGRGVSGCHMGCILRWRGRRTRASAYRAASERRDDARGVSTGRFAIRFQCSRVVPPVSVSWLTGCSRARRAPLAASGCLAGEGGQVEHEHVQREARIGVQVQRGLRPEQRPQEALRPLWPKRAALSRRLVARTAVAEQMRRAVGSQHDIAPPEHPHLDR